MEEQKKKSLSEISHLFLSSVRDNATGGTRPRRIPPGGEPLPPIPPLPRAPISIDLTPEEYARVIDDDFTAQPTEKAPVGPISALICSQFSPQQFDRAREYAQHLAATGERIGLLAVDQNQCTVTCFETHRGDDLPPSETTIAQTPRQMSEALEELAWDMDRWVVLLPNPRQPEARELLKKISHWVLLSTCDHDGVINCYRAIKGLAEMPRPRLTLALLNAADKTEAGNVYRKIANVCEQFLQWKMEAEPAVEPTDGICENELLTYHPSPVRPDAPNQPSQWDLISQFLTMAQTDAPAEPSTTTPTDAPDDIRSERFMSGESIPEPQPPEQPEPVTIQTKVEIPMTSTMHTPEDFESDIADLPDGQVTESAVLAAIVAKPASGLIQCPIRPPACPEAMLAVGRDRRLVLLGVTRKGLGELRAIALAYRWVIENRPLLSMAMPQFAIDAHAHPTLKLVIDRADTGADLLLPISENSNVTLQTYRKLRWGTKTGLLLEAA